jgi:hypothetical protein
VKPLSPPKLNLQNSATDVLTVEATEIVGYNNRAFMAGSSIMPSKIAKLKVALGAAYTAFRKMYYGQDAAAQAHSARLTEIKQAFSSACRDYDAVRGIIVTEEKSLGETSPDRVTESGLREILG